MLEKQIYELEGTYLENTRDFGNIFTGWNTYISLDNSYTNTDTSQFRPKKLILNDERLFSLSSSSSPATRRDELKKVSIFCHIS